MKKINLNNLMYKILIVFLIIQPIFDIKFFYNSISTLIRVIVIFALFLYYFLTNKSKHKFWLLIYPCLLGIYFIFHHLNALSFHSLVPGNFNYSIIEEALYFVKMISPFMLIYCIYKASIRQNTIINVMKTLTLILSLTIIISNLFVFSYGSYSDATIKANFFEWFNSNTNYSYRDLASKGLFEFGNQIAAILIMFLPFMIYSALEKRKIQDWLIVILNIFSLILLCTRVSVLGIFIVLIYTIIACCFIDFINKKHFKFKQYIPIIVILLVCILLLPFNPMFSRMARRQTIIENFDSEHNEINSMSDNISDGNTVNSTVLDVKNSTVNNTIKNDVKISDTRDYMIKYIEDNYEDKELHEQFLYENYPYKYDPEFWYDFLQKDISLTTDSRYIELSMIKRVVEINNNSLDKWLGITNTRLQNIFNIEKDFVVQYYALRYYWHISNFCAIFCNFTNFCI